MAEFRNQLRQTEEYQTLAGEEGQSGQGQPANGGGSGQGLDPVLSLEKTDIEFWMQIITVVLLFLIWREMARSNGRAAVAGVASGGAR